MHSCNREVCDASSRMDQESGRGVRTEAWLSARRPIAGRSRIRFTPLGPDPGGLFWGGRGGSSRVITLTQVALWLVLAGSLGGLRGGFFFMTAHIHGWVFLVLGLLNLMVLIYVIYLDRDRIGRNFPRRGAGEIGRVGRNDDWGGPRSSRSRPTQLSEDANETQDRDLR